MNQGNLFDAKQERSRIAQALVDKNAKRIRFKDKSKLHRLIGKLLSPFTKTYMTTFTTSFFGKIWFPSEKFLEEGLRFRPEAIYSTLNHELKHLKDERTFPILFHITYLFCNLLIIAGPGFRAFWEWRGYKETLRSRYKLMGVSALNDNLIDHITRQFVSSNYLWMWPFKKLVRRNINRYIQELKNGEHGSPLHFIVNEQKVE